MTDAGLYVALRIDAGFGACVSSSSFTAHLSARDRFLAPGGLVVPSQTRLVISAITAAKIWRERIDFWNRIYGGLAAK